MEETAKLQFHPDAAARFNELAQELLQSVSSFGPFEPAPSGTGEIHPVVQIPASDIIGEIRVESTAINGLGEEVGRYWNSNGLRVGWEGEGFERTKELAPNLPVRSPSKAKYLNVSLQRGIQLASRHTRAPADRLAERLHCRALLHCYRRPRNLDSSSPDLLDSGLRISH
jgi:hypothetical protein